MIKEAQKGYISKKNLTFEIADATCLPYANQSFDVVVIANALHIMEHSDKALQEIRRVLKNGGMLIAPNFVNHTEVNTFWKSFLKIVGVSFEHHWTEDTYPQYLESQGWKIEFSKTIVARLPLCYVECSQK